jgi:hypothetical protein
LVVTDGRRRANNHSFVKWDEAENRRGLRCHKEFVPGVRQRWSAKASCGTPVANGRIEEAAAKRKLANPKVWGDSREGVDRYFLDGVTRNVMIREDQLEQFNSLLS